MAVRGVLGVYKDLDTAIAGVDALNELGYKRDDFEVLTNAPYPEGTFGEESGMHRLGLFPLVGAACGFAVGLLITGATQMAYPLVTGGKPLFSIPPMIIIMYEGTLLAAVIFTVIGMLFESRLPRLGSSLWDPRISRGYIGILVHAPEEKADEAAATMRRAGAEDVILEERRVPAPARAPQQKGARA
ncbi:DUF3341 domain-containing protein [Sphaerobacter thermophilus]|jgi:hypothetical protein|uniref:DUF3341 domain-containing protein n=1 Tax=Sphaerobacter thermophilus (strain ATCC 49802 / DSM 20745 / KCCM 41009 / NCIMB 13125 / S 6022) TaxID=479434 RepID=D1C6G1_SPHTD|nr:DUF3341 domain-containing protein [Sphaerobacter thermophilus]ACZ39586.1 hypothetical protein Sthe_2160 [Sphaerobacter thermophilus DSM 20745]PZN61332.1 MAG: DUF3341 domain-containing protein [Sphaerobacter thermophilus]